MTRHTIVITTAIMLLVGTTIPLAAMAASPTDSLRVPAAAEPQAAPDDNNTTADDNNTTDGDPARDQEPRSVNVTADDDGFRIILSRADGTGEDNVTMTFDIANATYRITYGAATNTSLDTTFDTLVEYRDDNDNGMYDAGEPIRSSYALGADENDSSGGFPALQGTVTWDTPVVEDIEVDGVSGHLITTTATFGPVGNGTFVLETLVFGDYVTVDGHELQPTSAKVDVSIQEYPYLLGDTALALIMDSDSEATTGFGDDHDGLAADQAGIGTTDAFDGLDVALVHAWHDHARVDNETVDVKTTLLDDDGTDDAADDNTTADGRFALSYPRGDQIVHSQEAYVTTSSVEADGIIGEASGISPVLGLVAVSGLAALGGVLRRRE